MGNFSEVYAGLNTAQKQAVDTIDGPLLVIAGPGTGKTQLLSARVANILAKTDALPQNILCLTFTESGAQNMRERLTGFIGKDAYDVTISTYHSFGSEIIKRYSEYFQKINLDRTDDIRFERPLDELAQVQIVEHIIGALPFDSPLLSARYYIRSVVGTISDLKQHLISPDGLRGIATENLRTIERMQADLDVIVNNAGGISRKKNDKLQQYEALLTVLTKDSGDLAKQAAAELALAYEKMAEIGSVSPLSKWKDAWLHKNEHDNFTLTDATRSERMLALADVYEAYEKALQHQNAYDFDDMILRAIEGIRTNDELRFNLQERYQYILLDEFQDTNPAQFTLVKCIADHPVHEGRPNIMAVGDDDQAIFAFQGANVGNMQDFLDSFRDVAVINLTDNYRSHADILHVAGAISAQIDERLHARLPGIDKLLHAKNNGLPRNASIQRRTFAASASEYAWVAKQIDELIAGEVKPSEIAVLAPKHTLLENLVPFLHERQIPLTYEKRENILETDIATGLRLCAQLLAALASGDIARTNEYFPLVLSLPYWELPAKAIWQINWQFARHGETRSWAEIALTAEPLAPAVDFYLALAATAMSEPLEMTLDKLIGTLPVQDGTKELLSPYKQYYFSDAKLHNAADRFYETITYLSVIRSRLREYHSGQDRQLTLQDFLDFFAMYEAAELPLINSHPIAGGSDAVGLMTAYKAKGLEFAHVFILQAHDDVWGGASGSNNKLALPPNLSYIRYGSTTDDERLRLFFVAITRAKHGLYITSHTAKDTGKATLPLKYLAEADGVSPYLPAGAQHIIREPESKQQLQQDVETLWQANKLSLPVDFRDILAEPLAQYRLSPTHLNSFLDVEYAGPQTFLLQTLLRFPAAPNPSGEYGTAMHNTLEWYQNQITGGGAPNIQDTLARYAYELGRRYLRAADREHMLAKGHAALRAYLPARSEMFARPAKVEVNFYSDNIVLESARLSGKIDRIEIDEAAKTLRIVDYKTGKPFTHWNSTKAFKYKQQLLFYKLLIESSPSWRNYTVRDARLEFVEPTDGSKLAEPLVLEPSTDEMATFKQLIGVVWTHIMALTMPDISSYSSDLKGMRAFEKDLLNEAI